MGVVSAAPINQALIIKEVHKLGDDNKVRRGIEKLTHHTVYHDFLFGYSIIQHFR